MVVVREGVGEVEGVEVEGNETTITAQPMKAKLHELLDLAFYVFNSSLHSNGWEKHGVRGTMGGICREDPWRG